ncbi:PIAS4 ligase, partial [Amia calva]|nr:PIAS4 ligase [Amia calva]
MVKSFRVSDLQTLLASMGRSKSGLKQDLVGRALRLVQTECSPELLKNIRQLLNGLAKPPPSDVRLVDLPFYHTLETLLPPTELIPQNSEKLQDSPCTFELTHSQVDQIRNSRELRPGMKSVQVALRICYTDSSSPQEDQYPPNIAVKVNQAYCHVPGYYPSNKPGVEPRRPCRPINVTPWLHLSTATNRITVTWGNFGKVPSTDTALTALTRPSTRPWEGFSSPVLSPSVQRYCVALYLVQVFTSADLFSKLKRFSVESSERCRELIQDKLRFDPDSEIATTGLRVSLICPLVKMRLGVPCRVLTCAHLQCFDAVFFLQMNEKKPTWTCPVCDKPAPFALLIIDGLLSDILTETDEEVEEIEYLADGSWRPIRAEKEKERERERSNTPEFPTVDICSPEANGHSPAHSSTSLSGKSGVTGGAVVDLTQDSSSEEEEGGGAGDSEDTDDSQDSPQPKRGRYGYDKDLVTAY